MSMTANLRYALKKYGNTVRITQGGRTDSAKAFVQPLRRRHRLYIRDKVIPAGYFDNAYSLYIGDCEHRFRYGDGTVITCKGIRYTVVTAEEFVVGDEEVYEWAILMPQKRTEEHDYDILDR